VLLDEIKVNFDDGMQIDYISQMIQKSKKNEEPIFDKIQKITHLPRQSIFNLSSLGNMNKAESKSIFTEDIENTLSEKI
jgi:hypothetical protein